MTTLNSTNETNANDANVVLHNPLSIAIRDCMSAIHVSSTELHGLVCDLFMELRDIELMKDIVGHESLRTLFASTTRGVERRKIGEWIAEYTPLRAKWSPEGRFEKIIYSDKAKKAAEAANLPVWDVVSMRANHWCEFEGTTNNIKKVPKADAIKSATAKMLARMAYEQVATGNAADMHSAIRILSADFIADMERELASLMIDEAVKPTFATWCAERDASRSKEAQMERDEKSRDVKKEREKAEERSITIARLNATIQRDG